MSRADEPFDPVNKPKHYNVHPSGIECVEFAELFGFCTGNAIKYLWRAGLKDGEANLKDLSKAIWYLERSLTEALEPVQSAGVVKRRTEFAEKIIPHHAREMGYALQVIAEAENSPTSRKALRELAISWIKRYIAQRKEGA